MNPIRFTALALTLFLAPILAQGTPDQQRALALQDELVGLVERISPAFVTLGGGSGVVISEDGWVLTNHHVAGERKIGGRWKLYLSGGRAYWAQMVGTDALGDISLLKIDTDDKLPFLPLGDSEKVEVGEMVIALGNPYLVAIDATPTVTMGVVSAVHRNQGSYSDCIQTDTPINPGNSGGALVNLRGEVIGINGRIAVRFGHRVSTGCGFAIPSNQIKSFLPALKAGGFVAHGILDGLEVKDAIEKRAVEVSDVSSDAEKAGFAKGDLILVADGREVDSASRFLGIMGTIPADAEVEFVVQRGDERITLSGKLSARRDSFPEVGPDDPFLGVRMATKPPEGVEGVTVEDVVTGSAADVAGLQRGDIMTAIDDRPMHRPTDLTVILRSKKVGDQISIAIVRDGVKQMLTATLKARGGE